MINRPLLLYADICDITITMFLTCFTFFNLTFFALPLSTIHTQKTKDQWCLQIALYFNKLQQYLVTNIKRQQYSCHNNITLPILSAIISARFVISRNSGGLRSFQEISPWKIVKHKFIRKPKPQWYLPPMKSQNHFGTLFRRRLCLYQKFQHYFQQSMNNIVSIIIHYSMVHFKNTG